MKNYTVTENNAVITYTITEPSTRNEPFFLQNLMYDLPFDPTTIRSLSIEITIPKDLSVFIIDDLHFADTATTGGCSTNNITFALHENSQLMYQFFVANHQLCDLCERKELYDCQKLPATFEKKIEVTLQEPGAQAYLKCHYLGDGDGVCNVTTTQRHHAANTTSKVTAKSVLDDNAKFISDNTIVVPKGLKGIIAEQTNKNLVLSKNAHVISFPKLKVNSQQVACKHGATISSLDPQALFYLQSRGIAPIDAERLLIEAFLD